jgi:hypothetical protein
VDPVIVDGLSLGGESMIDTTQIFPGSIVEDYWGNRWRILKGMAQIDPPVYYVERAPGSSTDTKLSSGPQRMHYVNLKTVVDDE